MSIDLIDIIKQKNSAQFPLLEDTDLLGGMRVVADVAARSLIPLSYKKVGMFVWTVSTSQLWWLSSLPDSWTEFTGGGGGTSDRVIDTLITSTPTTVGMPVSLDGLGSLVAAVSTNLDPVYGLASVVALVGAPVSVVTSGVCEYGPAGLVPGAQVFLDVGGGVTQVPPVASISGRKIVSLGIARSASSILVRVELVAHT